MASPLINEQMVLDTLLLPLTYDSAPHICVAARLYLLACYDRKVLRDHFGPSIDSVSQLHMLIGRFLAVAEIRHRYLQNSPLQAELDAVLGDLFTRIEALRRQLIAQIRSLMECPWDQDTVH